jgi:hypothetical protein
MFVAAGNDDVAIVGHCAVFSCNCEGEILLFNDMYVAALEIPIRKERNG